MKLRKTMKKIFIGVAGFLLAAALLVAGLFIRQGVIAHRINDDYAALLSDAAYQRPVAASGVHYITQEISCGYAVIEMLARWQGRDITEQSLFDANGGKVSTAMGTGFLDEMRKQFPGWEIARHVALRNSELLRTVYASLAGGMPVPVELAALYDTGSTEVWTLHFALVTGMDLPGDAITVQNPYGYEEVYSVADFLSATRYDSYENMEIFLRFGFAFGLFHKNTVYIICKP